MAKAKATTPKSKTARPATAAKTTPKKTTATVGATLATSRFSGELVLGALCAELVGTFVLTVALLNSAGNVIIGAVTVMVLVMALSRLSGGHVNPAVTIGMWATKQISAIKAGGYIIAQILGAMLALVVVTQFVHATPIDQVTGQTATVFAAQDVVGQWRPFFGEALGGLIFGLGAAAAVLGRKNSHESGFIIGGALLLGLITATLGSGAILNPAVAIGLSAYHLANWWSVLAYAAGPVVGFVAGAWLYKLLQWDVAGKKEIKE